MAIFLTSRRATLFTPVTPTRVTSPPFPSTIKKCHPFRKNFGVKNGTGKGWHVAHANGKGGGDVVQMRGRVEEWHRKRVGRCGGGKGRDVTHMYAGEAKGRDVERIGTIS